MSGSAVLVAACLAAAGPLGACADAPSPPQASQLALSALGDADEGLALLGKLRKLRNSRPVLRDIEALYNVTAVLEQTMRELYEGGARGESKACPEEGAEPCHDVPNATGAPTALERPGNFHGVKSHSYYVGAISEAHPSLPHEAVHSIVASEWYHPGLKAKAVWCTSNCGAAGFPLAQRLDANFEAIQREVEAFWRQPEAAQELQGVGSHTTQFDRLIAGNGTWVDVRLWRGRAFNRRLCERHFRVICTIVEASPEIWTNPWSHVLLSILSHDSWVPFHEGHTNGQLTYHLPVRIPQIGVAELAVVEHGSMLSDEKASRRALLSHPEERTVQWLPGQTLVFDDSFTHAVRFRSGSTDAETAVSSTPFAGGAGEARIVLLMRGWHPELDPEEREALREFVRRGGEEDPEGYEMLPVGASAFRL